MLECLACVMPSRDGDFLRTSAMVRRLLGQFASCVCVLLHLDEEREALIRAMAAGGCDMWVLVLKGAGSGGGPGSGELEARGVSVIPVPVDRVARTLAGLGGQARPVGARAVSG